MNGFGILVTLLPLIGLVKIFAGANGFFSLKLLEFEMSSPQENLQSLRLTPASMENLGWTKFEENDTCINLRLPHAPASICDVQGSALNNTTMDFEQVPLLGDRKTMIQKYQLDKHLLVDDCDAMFRYLSGTLVEVPCVLVELGIKEITWF